MAGSTSRSRWRTDRRARSLRPPPYRQPGAGDIAGRIGQQPEDRFRHLLRAAAAGHGHAGGHARDPVRHPGIGVQFRLDQPGIYRIDADALRRSSLRQSHGQRIHRALAGGVVDPFPGAAKFRGAGGDVHDRAALRQHRQGFPAAGGEADDIGPQHLFPDRVGALAQRRLGAGDAGIVHQRIQPAEAVPHRGEGRGDRLGVPDIGLQRQHLRAGGLRRGFGLRRPCRVPGIGEGDIPAPRRRQPHHRRADAPPAAGHQQHLPVRHGPPLPRHLRAA